MSLRPSRSDSPRPRLRVISTGLVATLLAMGTASTAPVQALSLSLSTGNPTEGLINLACGLISQANACVRVVTHGIVNGNTVVRERDIAPGFGALGTLVGQPIDVTGDGVADLSVAIAVPVSLLPPGYDTQKPTLKVTRLGGAPATLPLKLEVVTNAGSVAGGKLSFGFDARASTLPTSFTAAIDQSDRDGNPQTSQVLVALTIAAGANRNLALVQESFIAGATLAEAQRRERDVTQLTFRAAAATPTSPATQVPTSVRLDVTSAPGAQRFVLNSAPAATADLLLAKPGDDPKITGSLSRLPTTIDLKLASTDTDGDATADKTAVTYSGSEPIGQAQFDFSEIASDTDPDNPAGPPIKHRRKLGVTALQFPTAVAFDYVSKQGAIHFESSARIPSVVVRGTDEKPFFQRATNIELTLTDVPRLLDAGFGNGDLTFSAQGYDAQNQKIEDQLVMLGFRAFDVPPPVRDACPPPLSCDFLGDASASGVSLDDTASPTNIGGPYLLQARVHRLRSANVVVSPEIDVYVDTAPDNTRPRCQNVIGVTCDSWRRFVALVHRGSPDFRDTITDIRAEVSELVPGTLFRQLRFGQSTSGDDSDDFGIIAYGNDGVGPSPDITVDATKFPGLPAGKNGVGASTLHVGLFGVPNALKFQYAGSGFPLKFEAEGSRDDSLDKMEVRISSPGATDRLAQTEPTSSSNNALRYLDGVFIRDFTDRFVIEARLRGLRRAVIDKDVQLRPDPCYPLTPDCIGLDPNAVLRAGLGAPGAGIVAANPCLEGDALCVSADIAASPERPRLLFDSRVGKDLATPPPPTGYWVTKTDVLVSRIDEIPGSVLVRKWAGEEGESRFLYNGSRRVAGEFSLDDNQETVQYLSGEPISSEGPRQQVRITPFPAHFEVCRDADSGICGEPSFGDRAANSGSLSLDADEPVRLTLVNFPNIAFDGTYTDVDLTFRHFALAAHTADGNSYIGLDTGWDSALGEPQPADRVKGGIRNRKEYAFYSEGEYFTFPPNFAADARVLKWVSTLELLVAQNGGNIYPLSRFGKVRCPNDITINVERAIGFDERTLTMNLGDDLCLQEGIGDPTPP